MSAFKIGEVAILTGLINSAERNGEECVIIGGLEWRTSINEKTGQRMLRQSYMVELRDGSCDIAPRNLRKRRPPSTDESESRQAMLDCIERAKRVQEVPA